MTNIKVDFIKVEYHFWKPITYNRIQFEENYNILMLPHKGDFINIGNNIYRVEQLTYYPFGDSEGQIGIKVYLSKNNC